MTKGRPRRFDPSVPKHIDQSKLPTGAYWDSRDRVWYTLTRDGNKQKRRRIAGAAATLADLHRVLQELNTANSTGTIRWVHTEFVASEQWKELTPATQTDYTKCLARLTKLKTKVGLTADLLVANRLGRVDVQLIVDEIARKTPAMANHVKRYLGRLFAWGMQRGRMRDRVNPAHGLDAATEKADAKIPTTEVYERVLEFARVRGAIQAHTKGSCPPYIWPSMVMTYRCRLRGVEALLLSDDDKHKDGIYGARRKGSKDNITRWSPELEAAWDAAVAYRNSVWARRRKEIPIQPKNRPLLVNQKGETLAKLNDKGEVVTRSTFDTAWQRFIRMAITEGVITKAERFTVHGLKHRGITDTDGDKQKAGGHKTPQMTERYDHEVPVVDQAQAKKRD